MHTYTVRVANTINNIKRKGSSSISPNKIYKPCGTHLGDCWSFVSYMLLNEARTISDGGNSGVNKKIIEIMPLLESKHRPSIISDPDVQGAGSFGHKYLRTKIKWQDGKFFNRICYQFDGRSNTGAKNMSKSKEKEMLECFNHLGVHATKLGSSLSLLNCVKVAAASDLFIGVESGMSHLCHSVGVPTFIIANKLDKDHIEKYHTPNKYESHQVDEILFATIYNLISSKKTMMQKGSVEDRRVNPNSPLVCSRPPSPLPRPYRKPRYRVAASI